MKKTGLLFLLFPLALCAQVFPFSEGFTGVLSGTLPAGWSGNMAVQADHGIDNLKGMAANVSSVQKEDSAITPWIGPLAPNSGLYFWYRIVEQYIYPSTEKHLSGGDIFTVAYTTDSVHYIPLYQIDSSNHQASLNFRKVVLPLNNMSGQTIKVKFYTRYGGGAKYFVDIDSVNLRAGIAVGIAEADDSPQVRCYPNPAPVGGVVYLRLGEGNKYPLNLYSSRGELLRSFPAAAAFSCPLEALSPGMYFFRAGSSVQKLMILPQ